MKLGLSMIVKNESQNLQNYLSKIYDLFDEIVIVDTGSTDDSLTVLNNLGIQHKSFLLNNSDLRLIDARNYSIQENQCDWVLILDGDEFISREDIILIKSYEPNRNVDGFFLRRQDYRYAKPFDDYKMALIRKDSVRYLFSVHACPQVYIRDKGGVGKRLNGVTIKHFQKPKKYREKYILQLQEGIKENPSCLRFYWFMGYYYYKNSNFDFAKANFEHIIKNASIRFPVETLNAHMILATIYQLEGNVIEAYNLIEDALQFFDSVKNDFEVRVNFKLKEWLTKNHLKLLSNSNTNLIPYEFAY